MPLCRSGPRVGRLLNGTRDYLAEVVAGPSLIILMTCAMGMPLFPFLMISFLLQNKEAAVLNSENNSVRYRDDTSRQRRSFDDMNPSALLTPTIRP